MGFILKLPKEINYAEAYLTLRCNLNCDYCINDPDDKTIRKRFELSAKEWTKLLNKIDFGEIPITLGGGEPSLHPEFLRIINGIKPETKLDLLTNLQFHPKDFIANVNPDKFNRSDNPAYKSIRVSYHPTKMDAEYISDKVLELQEAGFPIGLFGINHPDSISDNMQMAEIARKKQIYFFVKDFMGEHKGRMYGHFKYPRAISGKLEKSILCRSKEFLIAPDGLVYKCHRDLYRAENPIGNISTPEKLRLHEFNKCNNYGECNPCDIKLKTNRFLEAGNCQVDIKRRER